MNKDRVLLALVAADVLLAFSGIGAQIFFNWTLPTSLQEYAWSDSSGSGAWDASRFVLWAATSACGIAAWIGLVNSWWFARRLYVVAWTSTTLLTLLAGPSVQTPIGAMVGTLGSVVSGAIMGLVFFTDLSRRFERPAGADVTTRLAQRA